MNETRWYIAGGSQEPKRIELATVDMNSSGQDSANWEGSGSRMGTFQKFQNSLRNMYFSPLYILIYKTSWVAFDSIFEVILCHDLTGFIL